MQNIKKILYFFILNHIFMIYIIVIEIMPFGKELRKKFRIIFEK